MLLDSKKWKKVAEIAYFADVESEPEPPENLSDLELFKMFWLSKAFMRVPPSTDNSKFDYIEEDLNEIHMGIQQFETRLENAKAMNQH